MLMTKAKPNWTHVQREVIKCVQTREFLEIMAAGMFWQNTKGHKILSRKKGGKKVALLSKPHILLSQMVLLSEHLVPNPYWTAFLEEPCSKKKWLIWGTQTSAASFQAL